MCIVKISFNILEFQKMYLQEINSIFRYFCILISLKGRFIKNLLHAKIWKVFLTSPYAQTPLIARA